jgi:hypothetical protein
LVVSDDRLLFTLHPPPTTAVSHNFPQLLTFSAFYPTFELYELTYKILFSRDSSFMLDSGFS